MDTNDTDFLISLIEQGENVNVEFKKSQDELSSDIYETICAFSNRDGGYIFLGVEDSKKIAGVNRNRISAIYSKLALNTNNPEIINPPIHLETQEFEVDGKLVISIYVPSRDIVSHSKRKFYDRIYESDVDITNNQDLMFGLFNRKQKKHFEEQVYSDVSIDDLDSNTIQLAKKLAMARASQHPWSVMSDFDMLKNAGLIRANSKGQECVTLAAILLFGKADTITRVLPYYKTDALFHLQSDRYDDREVISGNLIESYNKLVDFSKKHLNNIFVLDGTTNVNARDIIVRELVSNTLAHRDYSSSRVSKFVINEQSIQVENASISRGFRVQREKGMFAPYSKNPLIAKMFMNIGYAEELGSGIRNTKKFTELYSETQPIFEEDGDIFKTIVPIKGIAVQKVGGNITDSYELSDTGFNQLDDVSCDSTEQKTEKDFSIDTHSIQVIIDLIRRQSRITRQQIAEELNISTKTVSRLIKEIPNLKFRGKGRHGYWEFEE